MKRPALAIAMAVFMGLFLACKEMRDKPRQQESDPKNLTSQIEETDACSQIKDDEISSPLVCKGKEINHCYRTNRSPFGGKKMHYVVSVNSCPPRADQFDLECKDMGGDNGWTLVNWKGFGWPADSKEHCIKLKREVESDLAKMRK
jgi:hypothetical protein